MRVRTQIGVAALPILAAEGNRLLWESRFAEASRYYLLAAPLAAQRFEYAREKALLRLAWICEERACGRHVEEPWA